MFGSGIGRVHNIAMSFLPGDASASRPYWQPDIIELEATVAARGAIPVLNPADVGYAPDLSRIAEVAVRKELFESRTCPCRRAPKDFTFTPTPSPDAPRHAGRRFLLGGQHGGDQGGIVWFHPSGVGASRRSSYRFTIWNSFPFSGNPRRRADSPRGVCH